jgi:hypothetical protein
MGSRTPDPIRKRVLRQWFQGLSRNHIATENQIGTGTVSKIISEYKENDPEFDIVRELAVMLKIEGNLDVNLFASAVRLRKILEKKELTEQQIESFIENIDIHSFRHGITFQEFTNALDKVCALSDEFRIQLDQLPQHITEQEKKLQMLRIEVRDIIQKKNKALQDCDLAERDLKEYDRIKTKITRIALMDDLALHFYGSTSVN